MKGGDFMKKHVILSFVLAAFIFCLCASAAESRLILVRPTLDFSETTVDCKVKITGNSSSDNISATIKFWENGSCTRTWKESAVGILDFRETVDVTKGNTYELTVDSVIAGAEQPTAIIKKAFS